jgi:peptide/nickel transport system permease protein
MLFWSNNSGAFPLGEWWWFVPPGLCIALVGAGLSLINLGLDELINPRLRVPRARAVRRRMQGAINAAPTDEKVSA